MLPSGAGIARATGKGLFPPRELWNAFRAEYHYLLIPCVCSTGRWPKHRDDAMADIKEPHTHRAAHRGGWRSQPAAGADTFWCPGLFPVYVRDIRMCSQAYHLRCARQCCPRACSACWRAANSCCRQQQPWLLQWEQPELGSGPHISGQRGEVAHVWCASPSQASIKRLHFLFLSFSKAAATLHLSSPQKPVILKANRNI